MPSPTFLVDTNVISDLARRTPNTGVLDWARTVSTVALSVVSVEEIFYGLSWKPNHRIQSWFEAFLTDHCVACPITEEIAKIAGHLRGHMAAKGEVRTQADILIAATAQVNQQTLVTRNVRYFERCGVPLLNPFS